MDTSLGFGRLEEYFEENVELGATRVFGLPIWTDSDFEASNNRDKIELYGYYYDSLKQQMGVRSLPIAGISGLSHKEKQQILDNAYDDAVTLYAQKQGLGTFDSAVDATEAIQRNTQQKNYEAAQQRIDDAYAEPEPNAEVDEFLGEFGL
jgi:hypothetical protein